MRLHPLLVAATVLAGLAACSKGGTDNAPANATAQASAPASAPAAPPCPPESPVMIDKIDVASSGTTASVRVNPDPVHVNRNSGGVRWTLNSPPGKTYEFTSDGITLKANAPPGLSSTAPGATQFVACFGTTTGDLIWPYTIKFVDKAAPATVWVCDPTITNRDTIDPKAAAVTLNCTKQP